jgi:GPH family glycoside/pentoside/hexuronide:cation symporter
LLLWAVSFYAPSSDANGGPLLPLTLVGALVFGGRLIDVVTDPAVGLWSDRIHSRWGRRIPFIAIGAPIMALAFIMVWMPPSGLSQPTLAAYVFIALGLLFLGHTLSGRPYDALLPEISRSSRERVNISALRVALGIIGATLGLVVSGLVIDQFGFVVMGLLIGTVGLVTRYAAIAGAWQWTYRDAQPDNLSVFEGFALIARNRPFRFYLPSFILFSMGLSMLVQLIPFHVSAVLQRGEGTVSLVSGIFLGVVILWLPVLSWITKARGKLWVYSRAMLATAAALPVLYVAGFLPGPSPLLQVALLVAVLGITMSAAFVLPPALMADIIDHDEEVTGHRREAVYYGTEQGAQKIGIALSTVILTQVLETFGNTQDEPLGIRLIGPIAAVLIAVGFLVFVWGYHLEPSPSPE